jgi:transcriptional regulator with XRE-family HTH domain
MENELKRVFADNLKRYMDRDKRSQSDIMRITGTSQSAVSDWLNAQKYPRMDKVEMLASYFGINLSDLVEENPINRKASNEEIEILILYRNSTERAKELARMALAAGQIEKGNVK